MASEQVMVTFPIGLRDRAHAAGLNVSGVAASAVLRTTQAIEKETGVNAAKQFSPAAASVQGGQNDISI